MQEASKESRRVSSCSPATGADIDGDCRLTAVRHEQSSSSALAISVEVLWARANAQMPCGSVAVTGRASAGSALRALPKSKTMRHVPQLVLGFATMKAELAERVSELVG